MQRLHSLQFYLILGILTSTQGLTMSAVVADDAVLEQGAAIYRKACQECHGADGQGVEEAYAEPLAGDMSVGELAELITETMPEEDPDSCVADEAVAVATYLHEAFYGEAAQVRNRPPRIVMARLTAEQLRQSLADLFGHFGDSPRTVDKRGIQGTYFKGTQRKEQDKKIDRVDAVIDFDFGDEGPGSGIQAEEFCIQWSGALKVDQTGRYEIILRSTCSCVMYFGDRERTLINNHVQSEGKEEFRQTLNLTAGHAYPIKIEFFQRKRKTKQPPAKVSLSWVLPGGAEEIIPQANLIPDSLPPSFPLQAKLPPDDRSYGYERGTSISRQWDDSTTQAALEFSSIAIEELYPQYRRRHRGDSDEDRGKLRGFLTEVVQTAFRGPLDEATKTLYIDSQIDVSEDDAEAIKRVLLASLKSPRFLYPMLDGDRSKSQRVANRLTLTLFDSLPSDDWLIKMVGKNELSQLPQVREAASRMVSDYRVQAKTRAFLHQWFDVSQRGELTKDRDQYPGFEPLLVTDLKRSFDAFLDEVVWSEASDFRQLLQADWMFTTDRMAEFYGDAWKPAEDVEEGLARSVSDSTVHVGALTHPLLMSEFAYHKTSSPIHRGVFLTRHVLGRVQRPPSGAFSPLNPDLHPGLTTRERVELQTGEVNCQTCHSKINSLGFALENFDAAGRFRTTEHEKPINAAGSYITRDDDNVEFNGARELGDFLAGSIDCQRSFVDSAFEHFVKQPLAAFGPDTSEELIKSFQESGFSIRDLIVSIAVIASEQEPASSSRT